MALNTPVVADGMWQSWIRTPSLWEILLGQYQSHLILSKTKNRLLLKVINRNWIDKHTHAALVIMSIVIDAVCFFNLALKEGGDSCISKKNLGSVGVMSSICHAQDSMFDIVSLIYAWAAKDNCPLRLRSREISNTSFVQPGITYGFHTIRHPKHLLSSKNHHDVPWYQGWQRIVTRTPRQQSCKAKLSMTQVFRLQILLLTIRHMNWWQ